MGCTISLRRKQFNRIFINTTYILYILTFSFLYPQEKLYAKEQFPDNKVFLDKETYILGPGDLIEIDVFQMPERRESHYILNDGTLPLPFIGNVHVKGLSLNMAKIKMESLLSNELINPDLQLKLLKPRPINVSVIGEVQRRGIYSLNIKDGNQVNDKTIYNAIGMPKVVDAIQKAGGITPKSNLREVLLYRELPLKETEYKIAKLNLIKLFTDGDNKQNPYLFDGDIIKIQKVKRIGDEEINLNKTNLARETIKVNIIGEVKNPGQLEIPSSTALSQAILIAGGLNDLRSSKRNVELLRTNQNGSVTLKRYKIDFAKNLSSKKNPVLENGDTVKINKTLFASGSDSIQLLSKPISGIVQTWSLFKLIND